MTDEQIAELKRSTRKSNDDGSYPMVYGKAVQELIAHTSEQREEIERLKMHEDLLKEVVSITERAEKAEEFIKATARHGCLFGGCDEAVWCLPCGARRFLND